MDIDNPIDTEGMTEENHNIPENDKSDFNEQQDYFEINDFNAEYEKVDGLRQVDNGQIPLAENSSRVTPDENLENLIRAFNSAGKGTDEDLQPIDFNSEQVLKSLEERDKKMTEILEKYKRLCQKKQTMITIQKTIAKKFSIPFNTAKSINESLFDDDGKVQNSIYVTNVDYAVKPEMLRECFAACGEIVRVTIPANSAGNPKGFAYLEFKEDSAVEKALAMTGSVLNEREIAVQRKRQNFPGLTRGGRQSFAVQRRAVGFRGRPFNMSRAASRTRRGFVGRGGFRGARAFRSRGLRMAKRYRG